jgi:hypothetical protein
LTLGAIEAVSGVMVILVMEPFRLSGNYSNRQQESTNRLPGRLLLRLNCKNRSRQVSSLVTR